MTKTIAAIFDTHEQAAKAATEIKDKGYKTEDISIIARGRSDRPTGAEDRSDTRSSSGEMYGGDTGTTGIYGAETGAGNMYGAKTGTGGMGGVFTGPVGADGAGTGARGSGGVFSGSEGVDTAPLRREERKSGDTEISEELAGDKKQVKDNISDGVITGGILGSLAGLLIGAGSMVIPGLGIIAAAGPITGVLAGGVSGAIIGGLIDLGIPEHKSKQYETDIKAGKILFSMKADKENFEQIGEILRRHGAVSVETY